MSSQLRLSDKVKDLKGVGEATEVLLGKLGIFTLFDLVMHFPSRYQDFSKIIPISDVEPGQITVNAVLEKISGRYVRRGLHITNAVVRDASGSISIVWYNQPYRERSMKVGGEYYFSGEFTFVGNRYVFNNPAAESVNNFKKNTARITPIYPLTKGLKLAKLRSLIWEARDVVDMLEEPLPDFIIDDNDFLSHKQAILNIHFPSSEALLVRAKERLSFDEVFAMQLASAQNKKQRSALRSHKIDFKEDQTAQFTKSLNFELTDAQRRASWEIIKDVNRTNPMNSLLHTLFI